MVNNTTQIMSKTVKCTQNKFSTKFNFFFLKKKKLFPFDSNKTRLKKKYTIITGEYSSKHNLMHCVWPMYINQTYKQFIITMQISQYCHNTIIIIVDGYKPTNSLLLHCKFRSIPDKILSHKSNDAHHLFNTRLLFRYIY